MYNTMYHDISSTVVIMLRQFDQWVPAPIIKCQGKTWEYNRRPPLVKNFNFFANRKSSKNIQLLDKNSY